MLITDLFQKKLNGTIAVPRLESLVVGVILGMVIFAWTLESMLNPAVVSTDLNIVATMVTKDRDASLYARDNLFANDELYRLYTPSYRRLVDWMWRLGGTFEAGLIWLVPPVMALYLLAMFILARRVTGNAWIALAVAVLSAHYHDTMGAGVWGVGEAAGMMPRVLFMPVIPLLTLVFLRLLDRPNWRMGAMSGLALGLAANLHPVSGLHFLLLLLAWLLLIHYRNWRGWQTAVAVGLMAIVGALPVTMNYVSNSNQAVDPALNFELFSRIVSERYPIFFFPRTFRWPLLDLQLTRPTLDVLAWFYLAMVILALGIYLWAGRRWPGLVRWAWLGGGLISVAYAHMIVLFGSPLLFVIVALYIIYRFRQGQYSRLDRWLMTLTGLVVLYAFVGYYLLTHLWLAFEMWAITSLLIEYARAARFVYLPIYLLAGLAGVVLWEHLQPRLIGQNTHRQRVGALLALGGFVLVLFGPLAPAARYLSLPGRDLVQPGSWVAQPASDPVDQELYDWVLANTERDSLFYGCFGPETMTYFRRKAQRSITHNWKDLAYNVYNRATLLDAYQRFRQLEAGCKAFDSAVGMAHALQVNYIMVPSDRATAFSHEACFVNQKYALFTLNPEGCPSKQASRR